MIAGCGFGTGSDAKTKEDRIKEEASEGVQENTFCKWQVLEPDIAAADVDFVGKVWKIKKDSFFIAEKKVKMLDDDTYFYVRNIQGDGESHKDAEAGFLDLKKDMTVEMKGGFENDVFCVSEIRLLEL